MSLAGHLANASPIADPLTGGIVAFLSEIGIVVRTGSIGRPTLLSGVIIDGGGLLVDESRLAYPGDLLHEAGHLAVMSAAQRSSASGDLLTDPGEEMAAIAWSWAAILRMGLDPRVVFHPDGYKGQSASIVENFSAGRYLGVPLLAWFGLVESEKTYPTMKKWLRDA